MRFFHTLREKEFVIKQLTKGNAIPLLKYCLYRLRISRFLKLKRKHYRMRVWYVPLAFWLWTHEAKEKSDESFFESFLKEGDIVIDCGAHLGTLSITAGGLVGKTGQVIACEMHPRTFSYLRRNIEENNLPNVFCLHTAIGDKKMEVSITDDYVSDMNHVSETGALTVSMTTIDSLASHYPRIRLIKLDVEGYELQALSGARSTLSKTDAVFFEAAERSFARYGYSLQEVIDFLEGQGFSLFRFDDMNALVSIDRAYTPNVKFENILAVKN